MTMYTPNGLSDTEALPGCTLPWTRYTMCTNQVLGGERVVTFHQFQADFVSDHGGCSAAHGFRDVHTKDFPAWNNVTGSESFFKDTAIAVDGSWCFRNESVMSPDNKFFEDGTGNPLAVVNGIESNWPPTAYDPCFAAGRQDQITVDNSQGNNELPWSHNLLGTSSKDNTVSRHVQKNADRHASTFGGRPSSDDDDDSETAIGTALKNGRFKCNMVQCSGKSYKRPAELRRHYNTKHAVKKPEFWCGVLHCDRSAAMGGRPFHRKYRLLDHMRKLHGDRVGLSDDDDDEAEE